MDAPFPAGKIPNAFLKGLLDRIPRDDPRLLVGPRVGEDAAVIRMGDRCLVAKTDPITFAADRIGWYLVHINANDIACLGAEPKWLLVTCLLPEKGSGPEAVEALFRDLNEGCAELGITLCGGHTEVTLGLDRPILVGQLLGEVAEDAFVDKRRMRAGDRILLTKGIAVEGTSVLSRECAGFVQGRLDPEALRRARAFLTEPGISVLKEARVAVQAGGQRLHGMHDPTEGGLVQGLRELALRVGLGLRVDAERIPVFRETRLLCELTGIDPMGLLASGALLVVVSPAGEEDVVRAIRGAGVACKRIGEMRPPEEGVCWVRGGRSEPLPRFPRDELVRVLEDSCAERGT